MQYFGNSEVQIQIMVCGQFWKWNNVLVRCVLKGHLVIEVENTESEILLKSSCDYLDWRRLLSHTYIVGGDVSDRVQIYRDTIILKICVVRNVVKAHR